MFSHVVQVVVPFGLFAPQPVASIAAALIIFHQASQIPPIILYALAVLTLALGIKPAINLFSRNQLMNYSWNRFHLVNAYGAFGSITKQRYEIVIEGSNDEQEWREYEFRAKPVDVKRGPPQIAPYHLRLDWLMWFLPFSVAVTPDRIQAIAFQRAQ